MNEIINILIYKFLIKNITFEGMLRIETLEYPIDALKEILLNALVHGRYVGCTIQIRVYDDRISIWNDGPLPDEITIEMLKIHHSSKPRNPLIADVCFKAGLIDSWGRGTLKILEAAKKANLPTPKMEELNGGFEVTLFKATPQVSPQATPQVTPQAISTETKILVILSGSEVNRITLSKQLSLKDLKHLKHAYLDPMIRKKLIEMTIPDKPTSSKQKYRITKKGEKYLKKHQNDKQLWI